MTGNCYFPGIGRPYSQATAVAQGSLAISSPYPGKACPGRAVTRIEQKCPTKSDATLALAEGTIIGDAYQIKELIGRGGMAEVYAAEHINLRRLCALKVIPPGHLTELNWQRFQQEARATAKLDHVNLVKVSDLGIHGGMIPYYAMELVQGNTLADMLAQFGSISLDLAIEILFQVCDGLAQAHDVGVIHCDLKPSKIMIGQSAGKLRVKLLGFGIAKQTKQDSEKQSLTAAADIAGNPLYMSPVYMSPVYMSPVYMSPEQCGGYQLDSRSDIYSLGCLLFECLTGRPPFTGRLAAGLIFNHQNVMPPSLRSAVLAKQFPEKMEVVMARLLRKNPAERYQNLAELRSDLQRIVTVAELAHLAMAG